MEENVYIVQPENSPHILDNRPKIIKENISG